MSIPFEPSPRLKSGDVGASETKLPGQIRRRSHRLSLTNWRLNNFPEGSITHVDIFLGSLTAISEELASSLAEKLRQHGAEVTMRSLESFRPDNYVDPSSVYRSPSRVAVFVVSTHVAGKPSPNAESFLEWLRAASDRVACSPATNPLQAGESHTPGAITPPPSTTPSTKAQSPRKLRINSEGELHRHHSLTDALLANIPASWLHPFSGGENHTASSKPIGPLLGVQYAVFGVGNSIYRTYNATAKYVDTRLQELGGVRVCPLGLGDVSKGIEFVFAKWEAQLLQTVSCQPSLTSHNAPVTARDPSKPPPRELLEPLSCAPVDTGSNVVAIMAEQTVENYPASVDLGLRPGELPRRLTQDSYQRRYSSATTMTIPRRETFDRGVAMPPLTDRRY